MPFKFTNEQLGGMTIRALEGYRTKLTQQMTRLRELGSNQLADQVAKEIDQVCGILAPKLQFFRRKVKPKS